MESPSEVWASCQVELVQVSRIDVFERPLAPVALTLVQIRETLNCHLTLSSRSAGIIDHWRQQVVDYCQGVDQRGGRDCTVHVTVRM